MNLRQLRYFVKVVEAGNMTRAAEQLHVAQPALGMQIRLMEEDLGVALLNRHSRGVEPTRAGALLHARATDILKLIEETRREISACDPEGAESVRLGLTPALMLQLGPELAVRMRERVPQVFLTLSEEMSHVLVESLVRGEIDLALAYDVPDLPHLARTAFFREDLVLVTQPGTVSGHSVSLGDALELALAMPERGDTVREVVARSAKDLGLEPRIEYEVRSIAAIKSLIQRGVAAGILPLASVMEEVRRGELDARPIVSPPIQRTLFLATSTRRERYRNELALTGVIRSCLDNLAVALGPLVHPLQPRGIEP